MSNTNKKIKIPFSLRLTEDEHAILKQAAGDGSMATFARERLFGDKANIRKKRGLSPVKDRAALGRVLGKLGAAQLRANFKDMADAAKAGCLVVDPKIEMALLEACADIVAMRSELMTALGLRGEKSPDTLTDSFRDAA